MMDLRIDMQRASFAQIGNLGLLLLWHILHLFVSIWYFLLGLAYVLQSHLISGGVLKSYKALNWASYVIELLQWLEAIGVKRVCLYDTEGVLKKSKEAILNKLKNAREFKAYEDLVDQNHMALEFSSFSDGKEAVTKAANLLFVSSCRGPDPDLLLVYGPARCHLGFPAWRIRYTEIVHMGQLKSMRYGSLIKAIYGFTTVRQNYGK
ncbi:dehydrodolichyl diphosphate synthase complex subunit NUS1 [Prunus yedoensis var. nudiflora]|uniref:ditrans,polycis-polyprenyl diphosphate synthase [(2E,6E)-farnesyldiphosphate specific] n=1 Tax=Prunus yedoensis var. nudiflora TaxID=2094558 RepID=A0A314ZV42_PRUYE|nr:dehydrodolichyl diphosphate synthase complex subunit NUS1 [Prunus yedoensis var. nudiflora]